MGLKHVKAFQIAEDFTLPLDAVTGKLAWLGQSGGGKTYGATKLAELMFAAGAQIIALDPVGVWWGLRAGADGKKGGLPILVMGGFRGDVPLTPESGALVAEVIVSKGISVVLDVSEFTIGQMHKFLIAFAERFFDLKKRNPGAVHVFLEEAHNFIPQQLPPDPNAATMMHRMERIIRVGRNYGIGSSQISQMPQAIAKKTLNQAEALFAFRTIGKHERKSLTEWFEHHGGEELAEKVPTLETGNAFLVSPTWLKVMKQIRIAKKTTFDSSETPKFGVKKSAPPALTEVDVAALRESMQAVVEEATKDDPKPLRKRIAELERDLKTYEKESAHLVEQRAKLLGELQAATVKEVPVIEPEQLAALKKHTALLREYRDRCAQSEQVVVAELNNIATVLKRFEAPGPGWERHGNVMLHKESGFARGVRPGDAPEYQHRHKVGVMANPGHRVDVANPELVDFKPTGKSKDILRVLAQFGTPMPRKQVAAWVVMDHEGGGFNNYIGVLNKAGLTMIPSEGYLQITDAGRAYAQANLLAEPITGKEIIDTWAVKLTGKARDIFRILCDEYPKAFSRADLADRVAMDPGGGGFNNYLGKMGTLGLIEKPTTGFVKAADLLFT